MGFLFFFPSLVGFFLRRVRVSGLNLACLFVFVLLYQHKAREAVLGFTMRVFGLDAMLFEVRQRSFIISRKVDEV